MKQKFILIALLLLGGVSLANAQYVNQKRISELDTDYIRVWSDSGPLLSSKITVRVDYGQEGRVPQISDDRRRPISFNGMIAVLNLLSKEGFELIQVVRDSKDEVEIFYLKRKSNATPYLGDIGKNNP
ncbi:MAG: hypothetical protein QM305_08430 [Bacteroidota bacterium]|jgi:hypothetical protein|nr:hypothetical protein [Bacteroidota bacterium]